jgi:hypothetical protein
MWSGSSSRISTSGALAGRTRVAGGPRGPAPSPRPIVRRRPAPGNPACHPIRRGAARSDSPPVAHSSRGVFLQGFGRECFPLPVLCCRAGEPRFTIRFWSKNRRSLGRIGSAFLSGERLTVRARPARRSAQPTRARVPGQPVPAAPSSYSASRAAHDRGRVESAPIQHPVHSVKQLVNAPRAFSAVLSDRQGGIKVASTAFASWPEKRKPHVFATWGLRSKPPQGFEPWTPALRKLCSTAELRRHKFCFFSHLRLNRCAIQLFFDTRSDTRYHLRKWPTVTSGRPWPQ